VVVVLVGWWAGGLVGWWAGGLVVAVIGLPLDCIVVRFITC